MVHGAFEYSNKKQSIEIYSPIRDANRLNERVRVVEDRLVI